MNHTMDEIYNKLPGREDQINNLIELLSEDGEPLPSSIFISGNMATGKTVCLTTVLDYLKYRHIFIDCIESYSLKIMFESIINELQKSEPYLKCDTLCGFINNLKSLKMEKKYDPIVLVFDRADRLRSMDHNLMITLLRLRELCKLNICSIFVSHIIYDNFYFKIGVYEPFKLYFPNYTKEELFKIIFLHHKSFVQYVSNNVTDSKIREDLEKSELFANFLNAFLSVFYRPCRDLMELQHMAKINFIKYCEPIIKNEILSNDLPKLWRHIAPILKTSLELLYLRINTSKMSTHSPGKENSDWMDHENFDSEKTLKEELTSTKTFAQSFELPYYAKFLLIAAYLASYNPPKEDKRLFMKNHGKQRKRLRQVKAKAKVNEKLNTQLGPKVFSLDRLLAIFYAILEERISLTSNLLVQIATLVELKLIAGNREIDLDLSKYKCIVGYDFIVAIAQTVGFNVRKYLYDFI